MYEVKVKSKFSSAHNLRQYKGKCEELHGHNWHVELVLFAEALNSAGMVLDFKDLKNLLNEVLAELDHKHLNELEWFKTVNPTSENIARYIYEKILSTNPELRIKKVTVWETDSSAATYIAD
ncbi:MAG: 6-carboxytetrahydropterin synthase QueD [Candidatus Omnitrophota bacterium]|nr:6-carboxytetrahydropterin synthase QueD [Candidatus Omnitrophota bacterium]